ncbi:MAG: type II toxin-antitoxin system HicA family toxin [Polyangiaceae bacterium]|nr:type II toxin-antitoxin system HicA family toxin [Polyangiaceae bacterium]
MTNKQKLLDAIRNNPRDVRFTDLVRLLEGLGFVQVRQSGLHMVYQHDAHRDELVNLQSGGDGKAKPYQVRQVLAIIERCKLEVQ